MRLLVSDRPAVQLEALREQAARLLSGIPSRARVVLRVSEPPLMAALLLECFERGLVAVPLDPRTDERHTAFVLRHSEAEAIIDDRGTARGPGGELSPADDRLIIYTSGTTGNPKGVVLTRQAVESNARAVAGLHGFATRPHFSPLPLYHVNALCMSLMGCALTGGQLAIAGRFEPARDFAFIEAHGIETCSLVPALVRRLVEAAVPWPHSLRYVITAAAPLSSSLAAAFHKLYGPRLRQGYGLSESTNFSFVMPLLEDQEFVREYLQQHPPVGTPIPGTEFRLQGGEVQVRGTSLMRGYWHNPEATAAAFDEGWLRTGDTGVLRNGRLVLTGRKKEIILRGGETISPLEVEERLALAGLSCPLAAGALESERLGEEVALRAETRDARRTLEAVAQLPRALQPAFIAFDRLEATSTGKPRRRAMFGGLRALTLEPPRAGASPAPALPGTREAAGERARRLTALLGPVAGLTSAQLQQREAPAGEPRTEEFSMGALEEPRAELERLYRELPAGGLFVASELEALPAAGGAGPVGAGDLSRWSRLAWLAALAESGFSAFGLWILRSGSEDVGSVYWGRK